MVAPSLRDLERTGPPLTGSDLEPEAVLMLV